MRTPFAQSVIASLLLVATAFLFAVTAASYEASDHGVGATAAELHSDRSADEPSVSSAPDVDVTADVGKSRGDVSRDEARLGEVPSLPAVTLRPILFVTVAPMLQTEFTRLQI